MKKKVYGPLIRFSTLILIMLVGFNFLFFALSYDYNKKINILEDKVDLITNLLNEKIETDYSRHQEERLLIEEQMLSNFQTLEDTFNERVALIDLDLQSKITASELESKIATLNIESADFSVIVEQTIPTVVSIKSDRKGSGVIFDKRGYVMTNKHVVAGYENYDVIFVIDSEGITYIAEVVEVSSNRDLAVVKIIADKEFSYLKFARDEDIKVGSKVIAIGNPAGLLFTVSEGIISSTSRKVEDQTFIQTDVPINSGSSGGPLINAKKEIVGINTFKLVDAEGIGFAIPASAAKELAEQVLDR